MKRSSEKAPKPAASPNRKKAKHADETTEAVARRSTDRSLLHGLVQDLSSERPRAGRNEKAVMSPPLSRALPSYHPAGMAGLSHPVSSLLTRQAISSLPSSNSLSSLLRHLPMPLPLQQPSEILPHPTELHATFPSLSSSSSLTRQMLLENATLSRLAGMSLSPQDQWRLLGLEAVDSLFPRQDLLQYEMLRRSRLATSNAALGPLGLPWPGSAPSGVVWGETTPSPAFVRTSGSAQLPQAVPSDACCYPDTAEDIPLSLPTDKSNLSEYQCLVREQIQLFAATQADIESSAQGRNRPIVAQQVGVRCRHCASLPPSRRSRGAVYYPAKLSGLYQAAQNMTLNHFATTCENMPSPLRDQLLRLKSRKSYVLGGGKSYWARGGRICNLVEIDDRLFFRDQVPTNLQHGLNRKDASC